jgi:hypothetical protein
LIRRILSLLTLIGAAALSVHAQTTPPPPRYDARFVLTNGAVYEGTTTFVVDARGTVSGRMVLTVPTPVNSDLAGSLKDGVWTFKYAYQAPEQQCSGTVTGTAKVPTDRKLISGNAMIGGCSEEPLAAVFTFTLQPKKN